MQLERAVAFDMDGVLLDGMKYHVRAWKEMFHNELSIDLEEETIYLGEGYKGEVFIKEVALSYGIDLLPEKIDLLHKIKRQYFNSIFRVKPIPNAKLTVEIAKAMNYRVVLVTGSGTDVASKVLAELGVVDYFDFIVSGDDVKFGKPSPEPYQIAAQKLNFPPENCLVIENAPAGIKSAKAANMDCIALVTYLKEEYLGGADIILQGHCELQKWLQNELKYSKGVGPWELQKKSSMFSVQHLGSL